MNVKWANYAFFPNSAAGVWVTWATTTWLHNKAFRTQRWQPLACQLKCFRLKGDSSGSKNVHTSSPLAGRHFERLEYNGTEDPTLHNSLYSGVILKPPWYSASKSTTWMHDSCINDIILYYIAPDRLRHLSMLCCSRFGRDNTIDTSFGQIKHRVMNGDCVHHQSTFNTHAHTHTQTIQWELSNTWCILCHIMKCRFRDALG